MTPSIKADLRSNRGRPRIQFVLMLFRGAQLLRNSPRLPARILGLGVASLYRAITLNMYAIDMPTRTQVGHDFRIHHGFALVVHADAIIGHHVTVRQSTTIGATGTGAPSIGDYVDIGANAIILGRITIGDRAVIGAGAVVVKDVAAGTTVVGNPARPTGTSRN